MKLAAIITVLSAAVVSGAPVAPTTLRIVTWNLQWFPGGKTATKKSQDTQIALVREEIRKLNPDILILQEVGSQSALDETLKPLDPKWQTAVISAFQQGGFISGQQIAIAAKFPTEAAWAEPWKRGWAEAPRGYSYALFTINGKKLAVYGLHLKSNLGNPPENTSKREDAMEQLIAHINSGEERVAKADAVVIGGDFNTDNPDSPAGQSKGERTFGQLQKAGFSWSFEGIDHVRRITCPGKGKYPDACFDYFWTRGLKAPLSNIATAKGSDHLPVVIDIVIE